MKLKKKGIKLALNRAEKADLSIILVEPKTVDFTHFLSDILSKKAILVINKMDLGFDQIAKELKKYNPICISIKEEKNLDQLVNAIKKKLKNKFNLSGEIFITRERHRVELENCVEHLISFENKNSVEDFDKAAEDLRLATRHLGTIVGKVDVEEILGSIFNDFCIGK